MADSPGPNVAKVFDSIAETYDQTGVAFFRPVAERLVELLEPQPGERALDIGCGRGAATVPLAHAVGRNGAVEAVDVSPSMVAATRALVEDLGLSQVRVDLADAAGLPEQPHDSYDIVASSLVLFFLHDPAAALRGWVERLRPGGRIGLTTFGPLDEASHALDDLLLPFQPQDLLDARTSGQEGPFASDEGMEELLSGAGAGEVRTVVEEAVLEFADTATWQRFSMATTQRAMWANVPESERDALIARAGDLLARTNPGGPGRLVWQMRYTLGVR